MFKKILMPMACLLLAACASSTPKIIQTVGNAEEIRLTVGLATQVEMPSSGRVQSVTVGNPTMVSAEKDGDVVNLVAKGPTGDTNLIIRFSEDGGKAKVFQYKIVVQDR